MGDVGWVSQNLECGDANANCPARLSMLQNFKHQIVCITMQYKTYQLHHSNSIFTSHYFPKVHLQRTLNHHFRRKIQHVSGEGTDKNTAAEFIKACHFKWKIICFMGREPCRWEGYPIPTLHSSTPPSFRIRPCSPQNSRQIYVTGWTNVQIAYSHSSSVYPCFSQVIDFSSAEKRSRLVRQNCNNKPVM